MVKVHTITFPVKYVETSQVWRCQPRGSMQLARFFAQARRMWLLGLQFIVSDDHLK